MTATIYYDGECPFCSRYVALVRLRETIGDVALVNLREDHGQRAALEAQGFDLDAGMVVDIDGERTGGADAASRLAMLSTPSGPFNRLNRAFFATPALAAVGYPVLRSGRWLTLFLMGRDLIGDDDASARQVLFSFFFGLFSLFHVFNYTFAYEKAQIDLIAVFAAALFLLWRPQSSRALFLLMAASLVSAIAQAPAQSNHTMLRNVVVLGYWLSFGWAMIRGRSTAAVFSNFVLAGRGSLLVMYVFGIFHKINTGFLNPETSCAMVLWRDMPPPLSLIGGPVMEFLAIYGTFAVEGAIMLALVFRPTRYLGLVAGIGFHLLLGLSDYAAYIAFTTLSIAMHTLWLSRAQSERITASPEMTLFRAKLAQPLYVAAFVALLAGGALAMFQHHWSFANVYLMPFVLPFCWLVLKYGRDEDAADRHRTAAWVIGALAAGVYFVSAAMPYAGLKTAQSINMFANLRLEAGVSNHLVFRTAPGRYLADVATIEDAGGSAFLADYQRRGFHIVWYDLLGHLADNPDRVVSFSMNGQAYSGVSAADFTDEIAATLHHPFIRKWFHFQPVQLDTPEACTL